MGEDAEVEDGEKAVDTDGQNVEQLLPPCAIIGTGLGLGASAGDTDRTPAAAACG
jgi:hypothetical protein